MMIISERINGLFRSVGRAIDARDGKIIGELALKQVEAGADMLDINIGPGAENPPETMKWLVETVQNYVDVPLSIDTPDINAMAVGIKTAKNKALINSTTADAKKMSVLFPLAREHGADVICLTMDEHGVPRDASERCELAMKMVTAAMDYGLSSENLFLDPLVLPVSSAQDHPAKVMESLQMFKMICEPKPKTVVGLSNISNGTKNRSLINRTYLVMLLSHGLDAAILDPSDVELMNSLKTAEVLLNRKLYCDDYLKA